jgi:ADP-ribose pyrophosphatase
MYEIFYENRALKFPQIEEKDLIATKTEQNNQKEVSSLLSFLKQWLESKSQGDQTLLETSSATLKTALEKCFRMTPAAGGLVLVGNKIVTIERNGIPDLPKGHIEKGETPEYAALREVKEETGLSLLSIVKEMPSTWHCYQYHGEWRLKRTFWYLMTTQADFSPVAQEEEGITTVKLTGKDEIHDFLKLTFRSISETLGVKMEKIIERTDHY